MAFSPVPSDWFSTGYDSDSGAHTVSFNTAEGTPATLAQLTDALADPTTGDIRSIMMAMCEGFFQAYLAQGADIPTRMTITRNTSTGPSNTTVFNYTFKFTVDATEITVAAE